MSETTVRERPILFSGEMVRAILDGRKTQTRRVVKPQPYFLCAFGEVTQDPERIRYYKTANEGGNWMWKDSCWGCSGDYLTPPISRGCAYGQPGDRLWVRETWQTDPAGKWGTCYRATGHSPACQIHDHLWRPSIFMPRSASRLTLELTDVRVERVQDISEADAKAEGFADTERDLPKLNREIGGGFRIVGWHESISASGNFALTWDRLNAKRGYDWDANPWVWVVSFRATPPSAEQSTP